MRKLLRRAKIEFRAPGEDQKIVKKEIVSARTGESVKSAGGKRKIRFRITYGDGTTWTSQAVKPSKAELKAFKAITPWKEPRVMEGGPRAKKLVFDRCLTIERGGVYSTTREAVDALLGSWNMPTKGFFEVLIFWQVWADKQKKKALEAQPAKRFLVNAEAMYKGYRKFRKSLIDMKMDDLADMLGVETDELGEYADAVRNYKIELKHSGEIPKTATKAFIEKQILSIAQGRGVYISDKSMFDAPKKKGKKKRKAAVQAELSELCIRVWTAEAPTRGKTWRKRTRKPKKKR